ncbi:general stress protein [Virgibacillus profundi]|uniref:General stress protein n=1 Tax=Virgibacillus profundi TaxID=2024555 RepID=A0A2A2I9Q0_9BACI|nr:DUF948 domain-containing protein [Virgibacillus profundi]PAV27860.1 general stress protein [Virgibacillus profundi]PXY52038.1 DUF948 domain-containing protein [Virgibacillus profundi]
MGIIYLTCLLLAIAFVIIVIYAALVLKRISDTMRTLGKTLGEVETELQHITPELRKTVQETENIVDDMSDKLKATDSLFDTMENVGVSVNAVNQVYDRNSKKLSDEEFDSKMKPVIEGIKWSEAAFLLYSKWKKQKPTEKNEVMLQDENTNIVPFKQS